MAAEQQIAALDRITDQHAHVPVSPEFSAPSARLIVRRCETLQIQPPLVIRRFQDRAVGPKGPDGKRDKIARDFYGTEYAKLPTAKADQVTELHNMLWNPATGHPYLKKGLTFIEARHLLIEAYREESGNYPQEIRAALSDFRRGLEKDIDEAAKAAGFFPEYSKANQALRIAAAGTHRINQGIPLTSRSIPPASTIGIPDRR